jgi:hypothetical protein
MIEDEDGGAQQGDFAEICGDASKHVEWAGRLCKERCLYNEDPFKSVSTVSHSTHRYIGQGAGQLMSTKQLCVNARIACTTGSKPCD